jgi:hypothetical protein
MDSLRKTGRFSIKTLLVRQNDFVRPVACEYFTKVSQLIKDRIGGTDDYTDIYTFCSYIKKRITKKHCKNCNFYKSITT